jgi:hypothetical protein
MGRTSRATSAAKAQPAIDRGRPATGGDHVLAVGNQFEVGEIPDGEASVLDLAMPRQEMAEVVAVAT